LEHRKSPDLSFFSFLVRNFGTAHSHTQGSTHTTMSAGHFFRANTHNLKGFQLPGISTAAREALAECLKDNYEHNHILFDLKSGFHNHLTHHLIAAFALGASADRLKAIHQYQSRFELPIRPAHGDVESFDPEQHWGNDEYYNDYLRYFTRVIEERDGGNGTRTVERWMFEEEMGRRAQFYARCLSGAYHPFIHLGYGLEFELNSMIAEGLAQAAVHSNSVASLMADGGENGCGSKSAKEVALAVSEDSELANKVHFEDNPKLKALLSRDGGPILRQHASEWSCPVNQVYEKAHELQQLAIAVFGGAVHPDKQVKFDFFLMHAVTSSVFLPVFVRSLHPEHAARLLRDKMTVDLAYFISRGRPKLNLDQLLTYSCQSGLDGNENPWFGIWDAVLNHTKYQDEHIIKTIRALSYADQCHHDIGFLKQESYLGIARMVIDNITSSEDWDRNGLGFDESWRHVPDRQGLTFPGDRIAL